jgi:hypothetical protein
MLKQVTALLIALLVGGFVFVCVESYSSSFQDCISQQSSETLADQNKSKNEILSFGVSRFRCTERFADQHNALITALATILLAVVTLGLVWNAAEQQKTTRAQLRAYIFPGTAKIENADSLAGVLEAHVYIKNSGQTPAYDVVSVTGLALSRYPSSDDLNLTITDRELVEAQTRTSMGPGQIEVAIASARPSLSRPLTMEERDKLVAGTAIIYVYGRIDYRDIFGASQRTTFRFMAGGPVGLRGNQMVACQEGNQAS